tara:strand:+ start:5617 stop:6696 length:1080 start_codon:yes stop_codon:yes gene_type:complete
MKRINYLDGHRGIAILLVMLFHAFSRWVDLVPYGNEYASFPLFSHGGLAVRLFFILSGYVILMTLENSNGIANFLYKRWLRLFPAMLICSLIIFFSASYFTERPQGIPQAIDMIPGLLFIEHSILSDITGIKFGILEGAFWSLYVEFKFYILAAIVYFTFGSRTLVAVLFIASLSWLIMFQLNHYFNNPFVNQVLSILNLLNLKHFGWFAAGTAFYVFSKSGNKTWFILALIICLVSSFSVAIDGYGLGAFFATLAFSGFFALSLINTTLQNLISNRLFLILGYISYPLYLLHENMMISMIIKFNQFVPSQFNFILPFIAILLIATLAYIITKYLELPIKKLIQKILHNIAPNRLKNVT